MEVSLGFIVCLIAFALYAWNSHNNQVAELERKRFEQEQEIKRLQSQQQQLPATFGRSQENKIIHKVETIREIHYFPAPQPPPLPRALPLANIFVQVIFKKNGKKRYDYYLGNNYDVRVGDFVEVYAKDKWTGKSRLRIAKVMYISAPGETSVYANTVIERKTSRPSWWR